MTGVRIAPQVVGELARHPRIIGMKDSSRDMEYLQAVHLRHCRCGFPDRDRQRLDSAGQPIARRTRHDRGQFQSGSGARVGIYAAFTAAISNGRRAAAGSFSSSYRPAGAGFRLGLEGGVGDCRRVLGSAGAPASRLAADLYQQVSAIAALLPVEA